MNYKQKPFAVFDIDGTLIRWQLYHLLAEKFIQNGYFNQEQIELIEKFKNKWLTRDSRESFNEYEKELVINMELTFPKIPADKYKEMSVEVFKENKDKTYTYTVNLINDLKRKGYLLFLISGSMEEIVEQIANYFNFDDFAGSKLIINKNKIDRHDLVMTHQNKALILNEFIKKYSASKTGSIGVGDTDGDIEMLKLVEKPIAFNPNLRFYKFAKLNHWDIVIERKNVVYTLNYSDGKYQLANSD